MYRDQIHLLPWTTVLLLFPTFGCGETGQRASEPPGEEPEPPFTVVTDELLRAGHWGNAANWPMYGGDYSQARYSALRQINTKNVHRLRPAWIYQAGIARSFQATPVVVGREMYLTTPMVEQIQYVVKLDAKTGRRLWETALRQESSLFCCGPNNRGVAVWGDKVYVATLDASLVALDARTGAEVWKAQTGDRAAGYSQTMAPLAYEGRVLVGTSGAEYGIRGFVKAYDSETGRLLWTWHTIPAPEDGGWWGQWIETAPGTNLSLNRDIAKEKADSARYANAWQHGGGSVWMTPALDPERSLVYVTVGNPGPDLDGSVRPGDNRWTNSVCALQVADGRMQWCSQYLPHDLWDLDAASPPFLLEIGKAGRTIPAVGHFSKVGFLYVWDRATGELVTRSDSYVPQQNLFARITVEGVVVAPGPGGGTNWSPAAYNAATGYAYSVNSHWPLRLSTLAEPEAWQPGRRYLGGQWRMAPGEEGEVSQGRWGNVVAVDPVSGKVAWETRTADPMLGGVITTAGGLVFAGQAAGTFDAWDAKTGEHLWQFSAGAGCNAAPMAYSVDGRQFVVVACGGNSLLRGFGIQGRGGDALIAFALP